MYSLNFVCVGNDCVFLQKRNAPMINGVCHRNSALFIAFFKLCVLRTFIFAFGFRMCYCGRVIITVEVLKFLEMTWSEHHSRVLWPSWPFFFFIIIIDFFIARTTLEAVPQLLTIRKKFYIHIEAFIETCNCRKTSILSTRNIVSILNNSRVSFDNKIV